MGIPDDLFVRGHHPHKDVLEILKKPFHFIGCYPTYFPKDIQECEEECENTCMSHIISNIYNIPNLVYKYTYIDRDGNSEDFTNYNDFYNSYIQKKDH